MNNLTFRQHLIRMIKLTPIYMISMALLFMPYIQGLIANTEVNAKVKSIQTEDVSEKSLIQGQPVKLLIPKVGINLKVMRGGVASDGNWILSENNAHHDIQSSLLNNKDGNTVIYGHDRDNVLRKTIDLKQGDSIKIISSNNLIFTYKLKNELIVRPDDVSVLDKTVKPQLTLITCYGYMSQERRILQFSFDSVKEINK